MSIPSTHTHSVYLEVQRSLSLARLGRYYQTTDTHACETLGRYQWNVALCEALYPALQTVEIAFRNALHDAATHEFGSPSWFDGSTVLLEQFFLNSVAKARTDLVRRKTPITPSGIVAELNFGAWNSLLNKAYDRVLWPQLIPKGLPHLPKEQKKRHILSVRFGRIKKLRNRVFHHEPIWHWRDLETQYDELIEAVGWINPDVAQVMATMDRFHTIRKSGYAPYCQPIRALMP